MTTIHANTPRDALAAHGGDGRHERRARSSDALHPPDHRPRPQPHRPARPRRRRPAPRASASPRSPARRGPTIMMQEIFRFDQRGVDADGPRAGRVRADRHPPQGHGDASSGPGSTSARPRRSLGLRSQMRTALVVLISLALLGLLEAGYPRSCTSSPDRRGRTSCAGACRSRGPEARSSSSLLRARGASPRARPSTLALAPALGAAARAPARAGRLPHDGGAALRASQLSVPSPGCSLGFWLGVVRRAPASAVVRAAFRCPSCSTARGSGGAGQLSEQLPEALDMMARSLRAGHALISAPSSWSRPRCRSPSPSSSPGPSRSSGWGCRSSAPCGRWRRALPSNGDLKIFAVSTVIQKETGGNLAEILDGIAATIRERYRFFGKLRSLTAEARVTRLVREPDAARAGRVLRLRLAGLHGAARRQRRSGGRILAGAWVPGCCGVVWFQRLTKFRLLGGGPCTSTGWLSS